MLFFITVAVFDVINGRFEITEEDGKQTLVAKDLKLDDAADFTCKIGDRETSAKLAVDEGKQRTIRVLCAIVTNREPHFYDIYVRDQHVCKTVDRVIIGNSPSKYCYLLTR